MGEENFSIKLKKLIEKHGWLIIVLLLAALVVSIAALLHERGKNKKKQG